MAMATGSRSRSIAGRLMLVSALVLALSLAFTGAASAQPALQANVAGTGTPRGCSNGATLCGTANIAGHGTASWNWFLTGVTPIQTSCGTTYTATEDFTLASDGSTLALNESGYICAPGKDAIGSSRRAPWRSGILITPTAPGPSIRPTRPGSSPG